MVLPNTHFPDEVGMVVRLRALLGFEEVRGSAAEGWTGAGPGFWATVLAISAGEGGRGRAESERGGRERRWDRRRGEGKGGSAEEALGGTLSRLVLERGRDGGLSKWSYSSGG